MSKELTQYNEKYYRVLFETAKLVKQAGFDELTNAKYTSEGWYSESCICRNSKEASFYSAPLIDVAMHWLKEKGYWIHFTDNPLPAMDGQYAEAYFVLDCEGISDTKTYKTKRDLELDFISSCCNHIITELQSTKE